MISLQDRYRGSLLGLAVGDAVGTAVEFRPPGSFAPLTDMIGGGVFHLLPGQWTDDTAMALCLAESLIASRGHDPMDQMKRYVRWWRHGHLSCTGTCFDIGSATRAALQGFKETEEPYAGSIDPARAGNGSLMRLAPIPLYFAKHPASAIAMAADMSRTTHGAPTAVDACRYMSGLIVAALQGMDKTELLAPLAAPAGFEWDSAPLVPEIDEIARGSFRRKNPPQIKGTGFVVRSLEAALWAFHHAQDFREGCLLAANLGDDADTTAAIFGQLAGAYYGVESIPEHWRQRVAMGERITQFADRLLELAA